LSNRDLFLIVFSALIVLVMAVVVQRTALVTIKPVIRHDFPDPAVLAVGPEFYAYSTASFYGRSLRHVPVARSTDLAGGWTTLGDALPQLPAWAALAPAGRGDVTAPDVRRRIDGSYLMYFVTPAVGVGVPCLGAAVSASPTGPFRPAPGPLLCEPGGIHLIDPAAFTDTDGRHYLLYSAGPSIIWIQEVAEDGITPIGVRRPLIQADRPEEDGIVEAPSLVKHGTEYVLFYSANNFNNGEYFANYATTSSLTTPFVKHPGQFLTQAVLGGSYPSPGGQTVLSDRRGDHLVFHASTGPHRRAMFEVDLRWGPTGNPILPPDNGLIRRNLTLDSSGTPQGTRPRPG
jgi:beta-xylosidase